MDKAQALQKVLDLNRLTASSTFDGEVEASKAMATQLRSKFDISDEDIAVAVHHDEGFTYFGDPIFRYGNKVKPHLTAIRDHIDAVLGEGGQRLGSSSHGAGDTSRAVLQKPA